MSNAKCKPTTPPRSPRAWLVDAAVKKIRMHASRTSAATRQVERQLRVRSGNGASVQVLQRALQRLMPFALVRTSEDVLDGSAQTEICVPTVADEYEMARTRAQSLFAHQRAGGGSNGLCRRGG